CPAHSLSDSGSDDGAGHDRAGDQHTEYGASDRERQCEPRVATTLVSGPQKEETDRPGDAPGPAHPRDRARGAETDCALLPVRPLVSGPQEGEPGRPGDAPDQEHPRDRARVAETDCALLPVGEGEHSRGVERCVLFGCIRWVVHEFSWIGCQLTNGTMSAGRL